MSSIVQQLTDCKRLRPPAWLAGNVAYETVMGSAAYGVSTDISDMDIYGFCIPPKELVFPHLAGEIPGFGSPMARFEQMQEHHIVDPEALGGAGRQYDLTIFSIVKYFQLAMENNPNVIDSLFTPATCVLHATGIGQRVREHRRDFLHRGAWLKFKGYAYSQIHKMDIKTPLDGSKRAADVATHGFDVKFAYHVVRLLDEIEQILQTGDIDLQRNREQLKAIRRGEWTALQIREHFSQKERYLESLYESSQLPAAANEAKIRTLLLECLESHYGSISDAVATPAAERQLLQQIREICERAGV